MPPLLNEKAVGLKTPRSEEEERTGEGDISGDNVRWRRRREERGEKEKEEEERQVGYRK